jgi:hypothetical protein
MPLRRLADGRRADGFGSGPYEIGDARPGRIEKADRAVSGIREMHCGLNDARQFRRQLEVAVDRDHRVDELANSRGTGELRHMVGWSKRGAGAPGHHAFG